MKIEIPIGKLAECLEEYKNITLLNNEEILVSDLGILIPTPNNNNATINFFIKKTNLAMLELSLSNGYKVQVAKQHILRQNNQDIFAADVKIGDNLDHTTDEAVVLDIREIPNQDCFDIGIDAPHLYTDANGLIHHNTLMTAALSSRVEKYGRSLIIVPNKSLVTQTEADYINMGLDVGVYFGERKEIGRTHTICTWQSINALLKRPSKKNEFEEHQIVIDKFFDNIACVIVDECFHGDSKVLTPNGYIPIKNLKVGDKVINYSEDNHSFKEDIIVKKHVNLTVSSTEKMYELEFDNGVAIRVTGNHKFLTNYGWCRADRLTENHEIIHQDINI